MWILILTALAFGQHEPPPDKPCLEDRIEDLEVVLEARAVELAAQAADVAHLLDLVEALPEEPVAPEEPEEPAPVTDTGEQPEETEDES